MDDIRMLKQLIRLFGGDAKVSSVLATLRLVLEMGPILRGVK